MKREDSTRAVSGDVVGAEGGNDDSAEARRAAEMVLRRPPAPEGGAGLERNVVPS